MNTIKLTRDNLHALSSSPGKAGFTRQQIEALGLSWPMKQGWLSGLIGKEISQEQYDRVKSLANPKWEGFAAKQEAQKGYWSVMVSNRQYEELQHMLKPGIDVTIVGSKKVLIYKKELHEASATNHIR